jgi:hypothetical protein
LRKGKFTQGFSMYFFFVLSVSSSCPLWFLIFFTTKPTEVYTKVTQEQRGDLVDKKRTYISRIENNGSNLTLKTLYEIVEKGLGGKVTISIEL